ncbi:uncharacterized protein LOC126761321 [Bactrocera neohumeralis]|uniref:uncharacterized protein LOC126761321 n=1 Tax=Bactrocera neohumeralis TaxID=98809 RepID=UPI0021658FAA|nr:uncharacterized protein LOC126761321 [Bactrocera neohumeralis]XP_050333336.1 uncharacterized protein LOC126761321 [Bactrocera neohumeralis]
MAAMDKIDSDILKVINSLECSKKQCLHCKDGIAAITSTIRNTLLEINDIQERNQERRHGELVALFEKYFKNDQIKTFGTSANVSLEDSEGSSNSLNSEHFVKDVKQLQFDAQAEKIAVSKTQKNKQSVNVRKRRVSLTENITQATPSKNLTGETNNLKGDPISCTSPTERVNVKANQRDELIAMREKMLAIQRRKMEDRERRKRESSAM